MEKKEETFPSCGKGTFKYVFTHAIPCEQADPEKNAVLVLAIKLLAAGQARATTMEASKGKGRGGRGT